MIKRFAWCVAVALAMSLCVAGCKKPSSSGTASGKKVHLAFITNNASDYWTICRAGCDRAHAENPNITVDFEIPGDGTAAGQKRIVDDLLARGIDGVAISPVDPANQTEMLNGIASQALLFTADSDAPQSNRMCYVGTDNVAAGKQAGELVKKAIPNGGKIMIFVGNLDAANARERLSGLKQALAGSNISIIDVRTDDADAGRAKRNVGDTLVNNPDVACLVGLWSYNGPAILSAVTDANKVGKVKIVCFDQEKDTIAGVASGGIYATVVQQPDVFGYDCMTMMAKYLSGDKSVVPSNKILYIPTLVIDAGNVADYEKTLNTIRGK